MLKKFAYIFKGTGFSGERCVMDSGKFEATIVGVSTIADACSIAKKLVEEGVQLIDLCGAFHKDGAMLISDAVDGAIRIAYVDGEIPVRKAI